MAHYKTYSDPDVCYKAVCKPPLEDSPFGSTRSDVEHNLGWTVSGKHFEPIPVLPSLSVRHTSEPTATPSSNRTAWRNRAMGVQSSRCHRVHGAYLSLGVQPQVAKKIAKESAQLNRKYDYTIATFGMHTRCLAYKAHNEWIKKENELLALQNVNKTLERTLNDALHDKNVRSRILLSESKPCKGKNR